MSSTIDVLSHLTSNITSLTTSITDNYRTIKNNYQLCGKWFSYFKYKSDSVLIVTNNYYEQNETNKLWTEVRIGKLIESARYYLWLM
jgi:hypothetical protein